jgi:hypothetical protein
MKPSRRAAANASRPRDGKPSRLEAGRVRRRNPLFSPTGFVRTNLVPRRPALNPLIVAPRFEQPAHDELGRVVGDARNPSPWQRTLDLTMQVAGGSLGGFGWNFLVGQIARTLEVQPTTADIVSIVGASAPALAFATFLRGDEAWQGALAGASLYDVWAMLARKLGVDGGTP